LFFWTNWLIIFFLRNMIQTSSLSFSFENSHNIIQNLNLKIENGEKYAILGPNGVGKTTILNLIWQQSFLKKHKSKAVLDLHRAFLTQDIPNILPSEILHGKSDFFQIQFEIFNQLVESGSNSRNETFQINYDNFLSWYLEVIETSIPNYKANFQNNLAIFGLNLRNLASEYSQLSPGTKKKILISSLLATEPTSILCDELSNHLDAEAVDSLIQILTKTKASILLVDHSSIFLNKLIQNWVYVPLNQDREPVIFKNVSYFEVLNELENRRRHQQKVLKNLNSKQRKLESSLKMQQDRVRIYGSNVGAAVKSLAKRIDIEVTQNSLHGSLDKVQDFSFKKNSKKDKAKKDIQINVKNLQFKIGTEAVQNILEFKLYHGEKARVFGKNGRGKTSFLQLIIQKLSRKNLAQNPQFLSGEIEVSQILDEQNIFVFQQVSNYPEGETLQSFILSKLQWQDYQVSGFLNKIRLEKFNAKTPLNNLSLGEFVRLQFGILAESISNLKLIILDEPGNFLDIFTQKALTNLISNYTGSLLLVTHDNYLASQINLDKQFEL